jgi:hypothetical protein
VLPGAGLVATAAVVQGPVSAAGATVVELRFSQVSGNTVIGVLACFGSQPAPTNHGLPHTATGGTLGQCAGI